MSDFNNVKINKIMFSKQSNESNVSGRLTLADSGTEIIFNASEAIFVEICLRVYTDQSLCNLQTEEVGNFNRLTSISLI